jgi:MFS family permease
LTDDDTWHKINGKQHPKQRVTWHHVRSAIFNVHTQVCAWTFFCSNAAVQSFGAFVPSILKAFGWTSTEAQLKSVPPYLVACVCTIALGWASDRVGQRGIFIAGVLPTSIIGFAMLRWTDSAEAKYAAVFLNAIGCFAASAGMLSWGINSEFNSTIPPT